MKNILLISPQYRGFKPEFPLGLGYVAAALESVGYRPKIIDLNIDDLSYLTKCLKEDWLFIGISGFTFAFKQIDDLVKQIRKANNSPLVLGGIIVNSYPEFMANYFTEVDYFVNGEGEITAVELAKNLENDEALFGSILGLIYRQNGEIIFNASRPLIKNIDTIDFPARHLFDLSKYAKLSNPPFSRNASIIGSRGCFAKCTFCFRNFNGEYRTRSVNSVLDEIELLINHYNIEYIDFRDELFLATDSRIMAFCSGIKERQLHFIWGAAIRIDSVKNKETYRAMRACGCIYLTMGTETASEKILEVMNKGVSKKTIIQSLSLMKNSGISVSTSFIVGMPGETKETIKETEEAIKSIGFPAGQVYLPRAFPGSWLYDYSIKNGFITNEIEYLNKVSVGSIFDLIVNYTDMSNSELLFRQKQMNGEMFFGSKFIHGQINMLYSIIAAKKWAVLVKYFCCYSVVILKDLLAF